MEMERFDDLTRQLSTTGVSRRSVLGALRRLLFASALASAPTRLDLMAEASAKANTQKRKSRSHRAQQPERNSRGQLQTEGKHKGKKHHKKRKDLPPLPSGCEDCNECQMCQDGACVPDPALGGVPCSGSGSTCSHCLNGVCTANEQLPCQDGVCAHRGTCCQGEKWCRDPDSSTGFSCLGPTDCCPGQKRCDNGCVAQNTCCPEQWTCADGSCVDQDVCCPNETRCDDGSCVSGGACCPGQKLCYPDSCVAEDACCPDIDFNTDPRHCGSCNHACDGEEECIEGTCQQPCSHPLGRCGTGCCPDDMTCHHTGACCRPRRPDEGGVGLLCVCASGYTAGCNGQCCKRCCYPHCCEGG
jgi:hypothetical protein